MDTLKLRNEFPALNLETAGRTTIFFDNAAGTQVARKVIDRMSDYFLNANANTGGVFTTSLRSDALLEETRRAIMAFINAPEADEIAFGANMTTLTQAFARAFARTCKPGDEIITTRLEHEANVSPWLALTEQGVIVRFVDINTDDATINLESLKSQLNERTKLVAVGYASNGFGTVNPVAEVAKLAHQVGAVCFVDAVHYSPHGLIDVKALDCDVMVFSIYKMFGPHIGVLWGKRDLLDCIPAYHLRTVKAIIPDKFETGTQNHEGIAGALGALEYLASLSSEEESLSAQLTATMIKIRAYEQQLSSRLLNVFKKHDHVKVYGITDEQRLSERVPTFAVRIDGYTPREIAIKFAEASINVWSGNYYALEPMTRLGLEETGGAVRISLVHYNTFDEIERLDEVLQSLRS